MMSALEQINLFENQLEPTWDGVQAAERDRNYYGASDLLGVLLDCAMMVGLIQWRQGTNPAASLRRVIEFATQGRELLNRIDNDQEHWKYAPFYRAIYVHGILDEMMDPDRYSRCDFSMWRNARLETMQIFLDYAVITAARTGTPPEGWDSLVSSFGAKKPHKLAAETYVEYVALVLALKDGQREKASVSVQRLSKLFASRKTNSFYSGGAQCEGGGADNDQIVDFRLAAILRTFGAGELAKELTDVLV